MFSWITGDRYPVIPESEESQDNGLKVSRSTISVFKILFVWVFPALLVIAGGLLLFRRKRM
jgi:hypothetical protein